MFEITIKLGITSELKDVLTRFGSADAATYADIEDLRVRMEELFRNQAAMIASIGRIQKYEGHIMASTAQDLIHAVQKIDGIVPSIKAVIEKLRTDLSEAIGKNGQVPPEVQAAIDQAVATLTGDLPALADAILANPTAEDVQTVVDAATDAGIPVPEANTDGTTTDASGAPVAVGGAGETGPVPGTKPDFQAGPA
ncbi:MAG: hypothetical protein ABIQ60_15565 [Burkholderiaceae bacterium]